MSPSVDKQCVAFEFSQNDYLILTASSSSPLPPPPSSPSGQQAWGVHPVLPGPLHDVVSRDVREGGGRRLRDRGLAPFGLLRLSEAPGESRGQADRVEE
jgi:hypothetical protein